MHEKGMALLEILVSMIILAVSALAVNATVSVVNSKQMRSAGGGSLDLQALNYARETLEVLKNNVSTDATRALPLSDSTANCAGIPAGTVCGVGQVHSAEGLPLTGLPGGSDLATKVSGTSTRTYRVQNISDGTGVASNYAYKKVTVSVNWTDPV